MKGHTQTPWKFGIDNCDGFIEKPTDYEGPGFYDNPSIVGADGKNVVGCDEYYIFNGKEDVDFILRAVNCHDELVEALKIAYEEIAPWISNDSADNNTKKTLDVLSNAINKSEGK